MSAKEVLRDVILSVVCFAAIASAEYGLGLCTFLPTMFIVYLLYTKLTPKE